MSNALHAKRVSCCKTLVPRMNSFRIGGIQEKKVGCGKVTCICVKFLLSFLEALVTKLHE
jgi:hypothetical protein